MGRPILTQTDLRGFTPTARSIVLDALDRGWSAYLSNKNHAVMQWPGGGSSAVARNLDGKRRLENARAQLARVERQNPLPDKEQQQMSDDVETEIETETWSPWKRYDGSVSHAVEVSSAGKYRCVICHAQYDTGPGTARHAPRAHGNEAITALAVAALNKQLGHSDLAPASAETRPEPEPEVEAAPVSETAESTVFQGGDVSALVELLTGKRVTELAVERERNARVRENLAAIRDLMAEVLNDRG